MQIEIFWRVFFIGTVSNSDHGRYTFKVQQSLRADNILYVGGAIVELNPSTILSGAKVINTLKLEKQGWIHKRRNGMGSYRWTH